MNAKYNFIDLVFTHYEAFGGPFFNHFIAWLTNIFSGHPSDYFDEFTLAFFLVSFLIWTYAILRSFEVKESFKLFYDWEMPWRNPLKKIFFGNIIGRYLLTLGLMAAIFMPIPVVQMMPIVGSSDSGTNEIRGWVVNDMKTSVGSYDNTYNLIPSIKGSVEKWDSLEQYAGMNNAVSRIPLIFYPLSMFQSFYYGFPEISAEDIFDKAAYENWGRFALKDNYISEAGPTVLSCVDKTFAKKIVDEQEVGRGSLTARISQSEEDTGFKCPSLAEGSDSYKKAGSSLAAMLFGNDVVSDVYKDFFTPIDDMFEIMRINSYSSMLHKGVNAASAQYDTLALSSGGIQNFNAGNYTQILSAFLKALEEKREAVDESIKKIAELNKTSAFPKELIDLAYWQIKNSGNSYNVPINNSNVPIVPIDYLESIWGRNASGPRDPDGKLTNAEFAKGVWGLIEQKAGDTQKAKNLADMELISISKAGIGNFMKGACGTKDCATSSTYTSENPAISKESMRVIFNDQMKTYFGYDEGNVNFLANATSLALNTDDDTIYIEDRDKTTNNVLDSDLSKIIINKSLYPTQDPTLKIGKYEYRSEALNNMAYKELDKILISTALSYAYIANIYKRISSFENDLRKWTESKSCTNSTSTDSCTTIKFKSSASTNFNYLLDGDTSTKVVNDALFGYYQSVYFQQSAALGWRDKPDTVLMPMDLITSYPEYNAEITDIGSHAKNLPFAKNYLEKSIWGYELNKEGEDADKAKYFLSELQDTINKDLPSIVENSGTPILNLETQLSLFFTTIGQLGHSIDTNRKYYDLGEVEVNVIEKRDSLAQWGSIKVDDKYEDRYGLVKEFDGLFSNSGLFFDKNGALHGIDPTSLTLFIPKDNQKDERSFGKVGLYYGHTGFSEPWSGFNGEVEDYKGQRAALAKTMSGNHERAMVLDFKDDFLNFILMMRPFLQEVNEKLIFKDQYLEGLAEKLGDNVASLRSKGFITLLAMIVNKDINHFKNSIKALEKDLSSLKVKRASLDDSKKKIGATDELKAGLDADIIDKEAEILGFAAKNQQSDGGTSILLLGKILDFVWSAVTEILNVFREYQNVFVYKTTDYYGISGNVYYPEVLIGSYGSSERQEAYYKKTNSTFLPTGAVRSDGTPIASILKTIGFILPESWFGAIATGGALWGAKKTFKWISSKVSVKIPKPKGIMEVIAKGIWWIVLALLAFFLSLFAAVFHFLLVILRLVFLGILSSILGFFTATIIYPLVFFLKMVGYVSKDNAQSTPIEDLLDKIPDATGILKTAFKQLSVWILALSTVFILVFVHKMIFYPLAQKLSFEAWISSIGGETISNWVTVFTIFFIGFIYYYLVKYTYSRLMQYMASITVSADSDVLKGAKEMMAKNSNMFRKLQSVASTKGKGIGRK